MHCIVTHATTKFFCNSYINKGRRRRKRERKRVAVLVGEGGVAVLVEGSEQGTGKISFKKYSDFMASVIPSQQFDILVTG